MKRITVDIDTDGSISIEAAGYQGNSCEEATQFLEESLGVIADKQYKSDYYCQANTNNQRRLHRGNPDDL